LMYNQNRSFLYSNRLSLLLHSVYKQSP